MVHVTRPESSFVCAAAAENDLKFDLIHSDREALATFKKLAKVDMILRLILCPYHPMYFYPQLNFRALKAPTFYCFSPHPVLCHATHCAG